MGAERARIVMNVVVLGLWHLGCVTAACCAEHFRVVGLDFDEETIGSLRDGRAPLFEPGLDELLRAGLDAGRLSFALGENAASLAAADILWVCYDTPVDENDVADVSFVVDRLEHCLGALRRGALVLISSQLPAGTCRRLAARHPTISFAYTPENLRLGIALKVFRQPERVIAGVRADDMPTRERLRDLFAPFCKRVIWMSPEAAEMTKHGINAFLALSVTFANELARLCEAVGADAREVEAGLRSEPRIGEKAYIRPGAAFSGGTLARDVVTLASLGREYGEEVALFPAIIASNEAHKGWALRTLQTRLEALAGAEVAVLGLTYKPGTDTLRRSSAVELCRALLAAGCQVRCFDPAVSVLPKELASAVQCASVEEAVRGADAAVVATEWPQIKALDWERLMRQLMRRPLLVDANRFLDLADDVLAHVEYCAVGSATAFAQR